MHLLDNIIWKALTTRQAGFAESFKHARRFVREVSPLAAFPDPTPEGYESLAGLVGTGETVGLFLEAPYQAQPGWGFIAGAPMPDHAIRTSRQRQIVRCCLFLQIHVLNILDRMSEEALA